ncbi:MAG: PilT protein domain protein, partial [Candidatus Woesebacteria bacterium GW2011_GWA1_39_8]
RLKPEDIDEAITLVNEECTIISITTPVKGVATHPEDDLVMSAAISAKVDYLVTGDQPLFNKVGNFYQGVTLATPNDFLKIL